MGRWKLSKHSIMFCALVFFVPARCLKMKTSSEMMMPDGLVHDVFHKHKVTESLHGAAELQGGREGFVKAVSDLRASAVSDIEKDLHILELTKNLDNVTLAELEAAVGNHVQRHYDNALREKASLSTIRQSSKKSSTGLFEMSDSTSQ